MSEHDERDLLAADEQRVGALLRTVEAPAPDALQRRIAAMAEPRRARGRRLAPAFALALAAAAAIVLALTLTGGTNTPTTIQAARSALAASSGPAPGHLVAAGTTIAFPDWSSRGWPPAGERSDRVNGRTVTTLFYTSPHAGRLGYSIVSGTPLTWGRSGHTVRRWGDRYSVLNAGGARIVTWLDGGHTCILASRTAPVAALIALASTQEHARAT